MLTECFKQVANIMCHLSVEQRVGVYFAACNFKTTDKSGLNLGIFQRVFPNGIKVSFRKSV